MITKQFAIFPRPNFARNTKIPKLVLQANFVHLEIKFGGKAFTS